MTLYKTTITPKSNFTTPLKGDTLFGQICWAIRYALGEDRLNELLSDYDKKPFLIVSDGFASGYLPKPSMPSHLLGENLELKQENRKRIWLSIEDLQGGNFKNAKIGGEIGYELTKNATIKNSINYLTFTTDDSGKFAPYALVEMKFSRQDIYFLLDDRFKLDELEKVLETVAKNGYGKRASIGKGVFEYSAFEKVAIKKRSNAFMALSPVVIDDENLKEFYYEPFTRFGKHGGGLANTNPFKSPILMADSSSVIVYNEICEKEYLGKAIRGHSANANTVHQGYSILIATEIKNAQ